MPLTRGKEPPMFRLVLRHRSLQQHFRSEFRKRSVRWFEEAVPLHHHDSHMFRGNRPLKSCRLQPVSRNTWRSLSILPGCSHLRLAASCHQVSHYRLQCRTSLTTTDLSHHVLLVTLLHIAQLIRPISHSRRLTRSHSRPLRLLQPYQNRAAWLKAWLRDRFKIS